MKNYYYRSTLSDFLQDSVQEIIGKISLENTFDARGTQGKSWEEQILILKAVLLDLEGIIFFEFSVPRIGKRIDCVLLIKGIVFVLEFKVGEYNYNNYDYMQVWDYALDLKNFHKPSHSAVIVPILVATEATSSTLEITSNTHKDNVVAPLKTNRFDLRRGIDHAIRLFASIPQVDFEDFASGSYYPTPSIIDAAVSIFNNNSVDEITRSDAEAKNLSTTSLAVSNIINDAQNASKKVICFVTGVPGAGKTLVGLKVAATHLNKNNSSQSVYLSGNAPLVSILQEALARDRVKRELALGNRITKNQAKQAVKAFIQIIHHYRDAYLVDKKAPFDHVAIFDEAQRAWNKEQTIKFMRQKKNIHDFDFSEPEFLISCLDRHKDWAVVVCLVGGGQEINTGEGGISEWINAIANRFPNWEVHISNNLTDSEYSAQEEIAALEKTSSVIYNTDLHLAVSRRSFRAENVSTFFKYVLEINKPLAKRYFAEISSKYAIAITRDIDKAKNWLKEKARGSQRYGMIVSSQAQRLKPYAIDVKTPINPINWFLDGKEDVRSSYYLEDVATEFHVQGLELDWVCVAWDGDLRYSEQGWQPFSFVGTKWQHIHKKERFKYLVNAYRVLLTRAREGMIIFIPTGSSEDPTRSPEYYDLTYEYLKEIGLQEV